MLDGKRYCFFCVSNIHHTGEMIKRLQKRPRVTCNNKNHASLIWGDKGAVQIYIPTLIDNYNHWMGGVDVSNQWISYYHPTNLPCRCTWSPIFIQFLFIIRNNAYLVYKQFLGKKCISHKKITFEMIRWLMNEGRKKIESRMRSNLPNQDGHILPNPAASISNTLHKQNCAFKYHP